MFYSEYFGDYGYFPNTLELDVETPFYGPGSKSHTSEKKHHSSLCVMSRTGVGKYLMMCKSKTGMIEEWTFKFSDWGLDLVSFTIHYYLLKKIIKLLIVRVNLNQHYHTIYFVNHLKFFSLHLSL